MEEPQKIVVVDVDMKLGTMIKFLVKLAIAFIPAGIILFFIGMIFAIVFASIGIFAGHAAT